MKYIPLFCRVIIKVSEKQKKDIYKTILPVANSEIEFGEVIAISDGFDANGKKIKMHVKVGDKIIFNKFSAIKFEEKRNLFILNQNDILIKIKN